MAALLILVLVCSGGNAFAQSVILEQEGGGVIERGIVLPAGQLNRAAAVTLARDFLVHHGGANAILMLTMGEDKLDVYTSRHHQYATAEADGCSEDTGKLSRYLEGIKNLGPVKRPIARVLSIKGNALLSYRDSNGLSEEIIAGKQDPTRLRVAGSDYQIVSVSFMIASGMLGDKNKFSLTYFLKSSPRISLSSGVALTQLFHSLLNIDSVSVVVRPDAWFVEENDAPFIPVFTKDLTVPSAAQYYLAPYVMCGYYRTNATRCSGRNFYP